MKKLLPNFTRLFLPLLLAGMLSALPADAKVKLKNELLTYEQMTEIINSPDSKSCLYILNGEFVSAATLQELETEHIVYVESFDKSRLKDLYSPKAVGDKVGAVSVAAMVPAIHSQGMHVATFLGSDLDNFRAWIAKYVRYPQSMFDEGIEGTVLMEFVVEKDGALSSFKALRSPHVDFTNEIIRIMKKSPRWTPGYKDGEPARVRFTLPIEFKK